MRIYTFAENCVRAGQVAAIDPDDLEREDLDKSMDYDVHEGTAEAIRAEAEADIENSLKCGAGHDLFLIRRARALLEAATRR